MSSSRTAWLGAAFLMATSAIGPGFLTQTTVFTAQLQASFGFAILLSIAIDLVVQVNIWRIISFSNKHGQDLANEAYKGAGHLLALLIVAGGWVFNIGNIAGCGLGLQVLFGWDVRLGASLSALVAIGIFVLKDAGRWMDWFVKILGVFMIGMMLFVVFTVNPPLAEALEKSLFPTAIDVKAIITIVGGTVGGYITFSGAHRLLDAGIYGEQGLPQANSSAITAIGAASLMRILLFLASLGVVAQGLPIDAANPPASVFQLAAGNWGFKLFGLVIWAAAITSVVGTSFTSVSFAQSWHPMVRARKAWFTVGFIVLATLSFAIFGKPIKVLIFAGTFNGVILAFSLGLMLLVAKRLKGYPNIAPLWWLGWAVVALMGIFGVWTML